MSSAAILALIRKKELEVQSLTGVKEYAAQLYSRYNCISTGFATAAAAVEATGTIDGMPIDQGITSQRAAQLSQVTNDAEQALNDVTNTISALEGEIDGLWGQYYAALAAEQAAWEESRKHMNVN